MRTKPFPPHVLTGVVLLGLIYAEPLDECEFRDTGSLLQFRRDEGKVYGRQSPQKRICIWSSGQTFGFNLNFMYMPFYATLVSGFSAYHDAASLVIDQRSLNSTEEIDGVTAMVEQLGLQKGDMFIWVGNAALDRVPWASMYDTGVYTIYFQTEPMGPCLPMPNVMVREIWDYALKNIEHCEIEGKGHDSWPTLRYVPSGFLQGTKKANHDKNWPSPTFFGSTFLRTCFDAVQASFGNQIQVQYEIWNQSQFDNFTNTPTIFIDIPKFCDSRLGVPSARMSQLLSAGAHIIALNYNPDDQKNFEGLVTFVPQDQLLEAYNQAASLPPQERSDQAARRIELYGQRFAPNLIFEKAGIYDLLDNWTLQG